MAWLLDVGGGQRVALGAAEVVHLLSELPQRFPVPRAPARCRDVFLWEDRPVPLANLSGTPPPSSVSGLVAVVAFDSGRPGSASYGGLQIATVPRRCRVGDEDAATLDAVAPALQVIAHAAFRQDGAVVPVLDLPALFLQPAA
jgi:hypothetical protein